MLLADEWSKPRVAFCCPPPFQVLVCWGSEGLVLIGLLRTQGHLFRRRCGAPCQHLVSGPLVLARLTVFHQVG